MSQISPDQAIALSQDFYANPTSYSPFSVTKLGQHIIGCIDPRDPAGVSHGDYKVMIQTAGGGAGEGLDVAMALTEVRGELVTPEAGAKFAKDTRVATVLDAHYGCRFVAGMPVVIDEMAYPSDFTVDSAMRWAQELGVCDVYASGYGMLQAGAFESQAEYAFEVAAQQKLDTIVRAVDLLYPEQPNVTSMFGQNTSKVYVINLHPNVGIDRNEKPADPEVAHAIQGYHDSLAASVTALGNTRGMSSEAREMRLAALICRSAAVRTVLTAGHMDEMTFLEVRATAAGVGIEEVKI